MKYRARIVDKLLKKKLEGIGAVLLEGPKLCGKTTSAEQASRSVIYLDSPDEREHNLHLAEIQPSLILAGDTPRLIDEWQIAPKLWDAVRFEVDHRQAVGQFILTGSAVPADRSKIMHSGTGRIAWLRLRTMSLLESGESNGSVSLEHLFESSDEIVTVNPINDIEFLSYLLCRGGWPTALDKQEEAALGRAFDYIEAVINVDMQRVDNTARDPSKTRRLLRSFARYQGGQVSNEALRRDIVANESERLSVDTVGSYINALKQLFLIEDMAAWNPNLRSKTAIRSSETRYFADPSIAAAALGVGPQDLVNDLQTFGLLFETMCVRDLRVYADYLGGQVYHYRDKSGLECDAVIHLHNGKYGLIEIKLGGETLIEQGAASLKALRAKIDIDKMSEPSFLMVIIGKGSYAYRRSDGVYVVPICCLGV